jgi:hypothetical protein
MLESLSPGLTCQQAFRSAGPATDSTRLVAAGIYGQRRKLVNAKKSGKFAA